MRRRRSAVAGEIGFVVGAGAAEGEDSGEGGDGAEDGVGVLGGEVDGVVEGEGGGHWENCSRGIFMADFL